jgi:L-rhamnose isomerase
MITLIKEQASGILNKREWWQVGSNTAVVAYGDNRCGIVILDLDRHDITERIAQELHSLNGFPATLIQTIDSCMIESTTDHLMSLLQDIEKILG